MATLLPAVGLAVVLEARWETSRANRVAGYDAVWLLRSTGFIYGPLLIAIGASEWVAIWNLQNPGATIGWHTTIVERTLISAFFVLVLWPAFLLMRLGAAGVGWFVYLTVRDVVRNPGLVIEGPRLWWRARRMDRRHRRFVAKMEVRRSEMEKRRNEDAEFQAMRDELLSAPPENRTPRMEELLREMTETREQMRDYMARIEAAEPQILAHRADIVAAEDEIRSLRGQRRAAARGRNRAAAERQARLLARLLPPPTAAPPEPTPPAQAESASARNATAAVRAPSPQPARRARVRRRSAAPQTRRPGSAVG